MKRRERNKGQARAEAVQIRESGRHPFGVLDRYVPLGAGELQLYRAIREAVPILDAAIWKLIRLAGGVAVKCGEPAAQAGLERFLRTVPTGRGQRGIQSFLDCYLDSMLSCGRGVGELVLDCQGREIAALLELPLPLPELLDRLEAEALAIQAEDIDMCEKISRYGLSLLHPGDGVLTHCNAGPLATSRYGTGQGPFHLAAQLGMKLKVYADETRPLLQGARLTAWELARAGVEVTLICDNMASMVMKNGWVQACMVGCDRVAANGDTANKIGTSGVAILAKHYGIPVYVLGPTSTIDMACPDGDHIPIEERDGEEIKTMWYEKPMALPEVKCYNPAFDVTDHELIAGIVTEKGICRPPYTKSLKALFDDKK